jgi:SAM-dependent methyltransferase
VPILAPGLESENDGYEVRFFENVARVEDESFWFAARNRLALWALEKHFPSAEDVLEVGCGTGFFLATLALRGGLTLSGSDLLSAGLVRARGRAPDARFLQMDVRRLPFDREFDLIFLLDVLEHVEEDEEALRSLHRALRPGGGLVVCVPQHAFLWGPADDFAHHKRRYSRADLVRKAKGAGFRILRSTSFVTLLMPLLVVARLTRRRGPYDPLAEHRAAKPLARGLGAVSTLERGLIRLGVPLPFGGSLLLVAERPPEAPAAP